MSYTIGFERSDGDFQILAVIQDNDQLLSSKDTMHLMSTIKNIISTAISGEVVSVRELDSDIIPDYI